jgi:hypothetical protein
MELVTVDFLGIALQSKFRKSNYAYIAKISRDIADQCYERALARLNRPDYEQGCRLEVSVGQGSLGLVRSVTMYRYLIEEGRESVQYLMSLRMSGNSCELSISQTVFSFFAELPNSDHLYLFGE